MSAGVIAASYVVVVVPPAGSNYSAILLADAPLAYYRLGESGAVPNVSAATASSNFGAEPPANAFDQYSTTYWTTAAVPTGWLQAQLATAAVVPRYSIKRRDDNPARNATAWTFEGSNDGSVWTVLDTRSAITWPTAGENKSFVTTNTTAYLYYRLNITANGGDTYLSVATLTLESLPALDSSGNGRGGFYLGNLALGAPGLVPGDADTAANFTNGALRVLSAAWMNVTNQLTVEAQVNFDTLAAQATVVERDPQTGNPRPWIMRVTSSGSLQVLINATITVSTLPNSVVPGLTHHLAFTYDGAMIRLYINGMESTSAAYTGALPAATQDLYIGRAEYNGLDAADGRLDEVAIYGTALSATRIAARNPARTPGVWNSGYTNENGTGVVQVAPLGGSSTERAVPGMDVTNVPANVYVDVSTDLWVSVYRPSVSKAANVYLRDGGPGGAILQSMVVPATTDSTNGHQTRFSPKWRTVSATGRLSVTAQSTTGEPAIYSDTRTFSALPVTQAGQFANPFSTGVIELVEMYATAERIIHSCDARIVTPNVAALVTINLWIAMNRPGKAKACTARLRDGGINGTVVATRAFPQNGEDVLGHQSQWSYSQLVTSTTGRLTLTIQGNADGPQITSDTRVFTVAAP